MGSLNGYVKESNIFQNTNDDMPYYKEFSINCKTSNNVSFKKSKNNLSIKKSFELDKINVFLEKINTNYIFKNSPVTNSKILFKSKDENSYSIFKNTEHKNNNYKSIYEDKNEKKGKINILI